MKKKHTVGEKRKLVNIGCYVSARKGDSHCWHWDNWDTLQFAMYLVSIAHCMLLIENTLTFAATFFQIL